MNESKTDKPTKPVPLHLSNGPTTAAIPTGRTWVSVAEFARITNIKPQTVSSYIKAGRIATTTHPLGNTRRVIPIRELNRTMLNPGGIIVPHHGRMYPHSFYLFYCIASFGPDYESLESELQRYNVVVPSQADAEEMEEAIFSTAPKAIKRRHKAGLRYNTLIDFEEWMTSLGFQEIYEDPIGYIPAKLMNSHRVRFVIEVMASAGFMPYEISDRVLEVTDLLIDPKIITNYLIMFFYHRQMEDRDWYDYLGDIRKTSPSEYRIRCECADSKVAVYQYLGLSGGADIFSEIEKSLYAATNLYRKMAMSESHAYQMDSVNQTRAMGNLVNVMQKWKDMKADASSDLQKRRDAANNPGMNPANIPEKSAVDDDEVFSDVIEKEPEDESVSSA